MIGDVEPREGGIRRGAYETREGGYQPAGQAKRNGLRRMSGSGRWWFHLRRCAECGHIGCCDSSPNRHALKHYAATGHPIITSFEPGEHWFYDYRTEETFAGPKLRVPHSHPSDQPAPGPVGRVPSNWQTLLHRAPWVALFAACHHPAVRQRACGCAEVEETPR